MPWLTEALLSSQRAFCLLAGTGDSVNPNWKAGWGGKRGDWANGGHGAQGMFSDGADRGNCLAGAKNQNFVLLQKSGVYGVGAVCAWWNSSGFDDRQADRCGYPFDPVTPQLGVPAWTLSPLRSP
jgi:hypothetical protein